ncbi:hypothetical protein AB4Z48_22955 [Cupriavidus sp. 2TAF22]|uniref:hypothetical protein n=1 Tax=unclassified Cupriavidus TaxID=2640874 RepID=UPI003F8F9F13
MNIHRIVVSCLLAGGPVVSHADTSLWPPSLDIKQMGDIPVACLPKEASTSIGLQVAAVAEIASGWPPKEWAIELMPGMKPLILRPGDCVFYGRPLRGYKEIGGSKPLEAGNTYGFAFRQTGQTGSRYVGIFCVQPRPDGHRVFLSYVDHPDGTTTYPACGRYIGNPPAADGIVPPDTPQP